MLIKVGELIKWHEVYDDFICAESGTGVVLGKITNNTELSSLSLTAYRIYRFKHSDVRVYNDKDVERISAQEQMSV